MKRFIFIGLLAICGLLTSGAVYINGYEYINSINITESASGTTIFGLVTIGDAGSTSHSLTADDDLLVTGKLEVDGVGYFDAITYHAAANRHLDNITIDFGTGNDAFIYYNATQTPDALAMGVGDDSRSFLIHEKGDFNVDFSHALQVNPTLYIQSSDATDITQFISFTHDQTNGVIDVGKGKLTTADAFQAADFYSGDGTQGMTGTCADGTDLTVKDGLITGCS